MPQIRLVLADRDQFFLEKFSAYLKNSKTIHFALELYTNPMLFSQWLDSGGTADLLVISSSFLTALENPPVPGRSVMVLCDGPENMIPTEYTIVSKYQSAENLVAEILAACAEGMPGSLRKKGTSGEIHLVLYADGSDVLDPLAPSLAYLKAQQGHASFYMNLDPFSDTHTYFNGSNVRGLSEFLYYIKSQKENLPLKAEACTSRDAEYGVEFMKSHNNPKDIAGLLPNEVKSLIEAIRDRAVYNHIIISRALQFDHILPLLINEAHNVYLTCLNHPSSYNRLKMIASYLANYESDLLNDLKRKMVCCIVLIHQNDQPLSIELPFEKAYIPYYANQGYTLFPPARDYLQVLENITSQERG